MWRNAPILIVVASMLVFSAGVQAGRDVTGPLDFVVGVPDDGDWPPNEVPRQACDDQVLTKYLHFKGGNVPSGIRVTPAMGPTVVTGLTFTTANDADYRDPVTYELSGSNDSIDGPYTLIAQGPIVDFAGSAAWPRQTKTTTPIQFANTVSYKHYQLLFPTIRNRATEPYMQIAEVELLTPVFKATNPVPANRGTQADTWANITWTPGETAASHDIYFADNFADVNDGTGGSFRGNQPLAMAYYIVGLPGFPFPDGLALGGTYYWRIDQLEANGTKHKGDVWSFTVPPKMAWNPSPRNGAKFVDKDADLSWTAGSGARLHYVYFGDKFDDVNNAKGGTPQGATTYVLPTLEAGKTYYWRVDEFDVVGTHKGDVWSFTIAAPGGGLLGEYFSNTDVTGTPAFVRIDPQVNFSWGGTGPGAPLPDNGWSARWTADLDIAFDDDYTFSVWSEGGTRLWIDDQLVINSWVSWVPTEYASLPIPLKAGVHSLRLQFADWSRDAQQVLYWTSPTIARQIIPAGPLMPPVLARRPNPISGTTGVNLMTVPTWKAGYLAVSHDVYFGTDAAAVANATKTSPEFKGTKAVGSESLDAGKLAFDTTYYWRVDEVNDANPKSPWKGNVWSFWTGNFLVVDDLESYNDIDPPAAGSNRIYDKWVDGYQTTTNGAVVGNNLPPYAEVGVLHGGAQAMPYAYDNNLKTSEAVLTLVYPKDWTEQGVTKLSLWLQGFATNAADKMYIALNGTAVVYHDNPAATQSKGWNEWVIDLQAFATQGVDLTNVNSITIGVGTKGAPAAGGTGTLYFDDIRLIKP